MYVCMYVILDLFAKHANVMTNNWNNSGKDSAPRNGRFIGIVQTSQTFANRIFVVQAIITEIRSETISATGSKLAMSQQTKRVSQGNVRINAQTFRDQTVVVAQLLSAATAIIDTNQH